MQNQPYQPGYAFQGGQPLRPNPFTQPVPPMPGYQPPQGQQPAQPTPLQPNPFGQPVQQPQGQQPVQPMPGYQQPQGQQPAQPMPGYQQPQGQQPVQPMPGYQPLQGQQPVQPMPGYQPPQGQQPGQPTSLQPNPFGQPAQQPIQNVQPTAAPVHQATVIPSEKLAKKAKGKKIRQAIIFGVWLAGSITYVATYRQDIPESIVEKFNQLTTYGQMDQFTPEHLLEISGLVFSNVIFLRDWIQSKRKYKDLKNEREEAITAMAQGRGI